MSDDRELGAQTPATPAKIVVVGPDGVAVETDADARPGVSNEVRALLPEAIRALNIRYILNSAPTVRGFKVPDGLVSIDQSKWWTKIYDNGEAWIYEWRGAPGPGQGE